MSKLFNITDQTRTNRAYKVYIEPYDSANGATTYLGYSEMDKIAKEKLTHANKGYKAQWGKDLIDEKSGTILWEEATVIADNDDDASSLSFSYQASWEGSKIADLVGDFIPQGVTLGMGKRLAKVGSGASKVATGSAAYHGTFPALNLNDRKLMAKPAYLTYNLKIKVVDKNADGEVLKMLTKLLIYTVPQTTVSSVTWDKVKQAAGEMWEEGKKISVATFTGQPIKADPVDGAKTDGNTTVPVTKESLNNTFNGLKAGAEFLTGMTPNVEILSTPVPVRIFISDYYVHNLCVIESINVNLSKQINEGGYPVYGTFDLSISSRELTPLDLGVDAEGTPPTTLRNVVFASNLSTRILPACLDSAEHNKRAAEMQAAADKRAKEAEAAKKTDGVKTEAPPKPPAWDAVPGKSNKQTKFDPIPLKLTRDQRAQKYGQAHGDHSYGDYNGRT